jgi:hypothetical protein
MIAFSVVPAQAPKADASPKPGAGAKGGREFLPPHTVGITYYAGASMTKIDGRSSLTRYRNDARWDCQTGYSTERFLGCE